MHLILALAAMTAPQEDISFNRDIRPILADRCFVCHGPDSAQRKADLRLDKEAVAKDVLSPGRPNESELLRRILSNDPDEQMPPQQSKLRITKDEADLIRRWIAGGARWEKHWSFIAPQRPQLPRVTEHVWAQNEIDLFILRNLEQKNISPSPSAAREQWLRRVTLDLTGLPPTIAELERFKSDPSPGAYAKVVDRLLDSPAFGERLALEWLDVARYGDTDGLFEDHPRSIYPWRDWVVRAFNNNLPYRDFIRWQLAGDLLPDASDDQRIATGFLRNNTTSNEGGIIDEDYRIKYLVDRVNTTATSMLGLTLECAQCHDHKYDPMTQREYYQFAGFFNSLIGNGNTKGATAPTLRRYSASQKTRKEAIRSQLAQIATRLKSTPKQLSRDFEAWQKKLELPINWTRPKAESKTLELQGHWLVATATPTVKDNPRAMNGRYVRVALKKGQTGFLTISEVEVVSKRVNVARSGKATQSSVGYNSPAAKAIDGKRDGSFASCSCTNSEKDAWWEVDLGSEVPIDYVAVYNRTDCCPERLDHVSVQILDAKRQVVSQRKLGKATKRNTLPDGAKDDQIVQQSHVVTLTSKQKVAALQLSLKKPGAVQINRVRRVGKGKPVDVKIHGLTKRNVGKDPVIVGLANSIHLGADEKIELTLQLPGRDGIQLQVTPDETAALRATLPKEQDKRLAHFRGQWPGFNKDREQQKALAEEDKQVDSAAPLTMVASDMGKLRDNYMLIRGEYDRRGDKVKTAAPASIYPYRDGLPSNRLGLAEWLTDRSNPLTARVAVNRYWQMLFGIGLVKTSEDFGTQGDRPSHPELLDWLAVDFVDSGWNTKALLKKIVLSSTYRQASVQQPAISKLDPENRWLSFFPRRRLSAESIRDHLLSSSNALINKHGGKGVNPYQPPELFGANAIGAAGTKFTQSKGEGLYRRSLYTYWKRQIPAANMRILGADGRTKCRTRRESTNTPLQALVLLNDPQSVEAARLMAIRCMSKSPLISKQLQLAFRLATSRIPSDNEMTILSAEFQDRLREFRADPKAAEAFLNVGESKTDSDIDKPQLAALSAVCGLIFNLDEAISKN